jgi:glycosyltransferase involved in cell wall biosynthesis
MPGPSTIEAEALQRLAVLIPVRHPEPILVDLACSLGAAGFGAILVVDDGSGSAGELVLRQLPSSGVVVLRHAVNLGKGRALKTGFNYLLVASSGLDAVITADADGQHTSSDILRVAQSLLTSNGRPVLGVRSFGGQVPLRSKFGNLLTRNIFAIVTGTRLTDTQTGLRGLPLSLLPQLITLAGERYEYEMTVLAHLCRGGARPVEVPIATVYLDGNRSSNFNPVWDSMRIYFVLVRFYFSAIFAACIDFAGFAAAFALTGNVLLSVVVGRLSSLVNFALNRKFVFQARSSIPVTLWRYYLLAVAVGGISYGSIVVLTTHLYWNIFVAKIAVDVPLSLVSFSVQRTFVFRHAKEA